MSNKSNKMQTLQQALSASTGKAPARVQPPESDHAPAKTPRSGGRARHINLTVWLAADFKSNLRLVQARKGPSATFQALLAEALNDLFIKYDVPTVEGE
jgi:hypothetical protein